MPRTLLASLAAASVGLLIAGQARAQDAITPAAGARLPVHVVVVNTFEIAGKFPGERQYWLQRFPFTEELAFPQGYAPLYYNPDRKALDIETGEGPVHMAASITALANDPRFDFTDAYWLLAGIAGIDPNIGPAGSVAWANYVVDGDLAYEIDAREIPPGWSTGYVPLGRTTPYEQPRPKVSSLNGTNLFRLNARLAKWAWQFSNSKVTLPDDSTLQQYRAPYADGFPRTQSPPKILRGDVLAAGTFWIGALLNTWAENWVTYWSDGKATFTMTSEEDAGYMQALTFLAQAGKVDLDRVMDLRGASDFSVPPQGKSAAQLLKQDVTSFKPPFVESLNDVYLAGSPIVYELTDYWSYYRSHIPGSAP